MALTPEEQQRLDNLTLFLPVLDEYYRDVALDPNVPIMNKPAYIAYMIGWLVWDDYKGEKKYLEDKKDKP